jgi:hypothetical protein
LVGPIRGWKAADDDFGTRRRHDVELVAYGEYVAVQKRFRANREGFVTEVTALDRLARAGCGVPPIWHVDPTTLTLIMPLVDGDSVRLLLEEAGASLGSTVATPDARLSREERRDRRAQEAAAFLDRALPPTLRETLFESLRAIHLAGVIGNDITYANILLPGRDARPIWIDFDHARWFPRRLARRLLRPLRDRDVERFDTFFGTRHLTRRRAADLIAAANREFAASLPRTSLRYGLALGNPSVARPAPLHLSDTDVRERDIVDLTPGSGSRALALLRRGARSVTAIAKDVETRAALEVVRDVAEWSDDRTYDLRLGGESELRACEEAPCDLLVADVAPSSPLAEALPAIVRLRPRSLAIACGSTDVSGSRMTSSTMNCIELAIAEAGYRLRPRRRRLELRADAEAPGHA